jgi:hypothetical protein
MTCNFKAQNRICNLEDLHDGCHVDSLGFKFIDESWLNHLGNGPDGYPMNNAAFDVAVKKVLDSRAEDIKAAKEFRRKLQNFFRRGKA